MKFTQQQAIEALKAVGVQAVEIVEKPEEADYNENTLLQTVDAARTDIIKPKITAELEETLKGQIAGLAGGKLIGQLVKLTGIPRAEIKDIKDDEEKIKLALEFREQKYSQDTADLRKDYDDLVKKHEADLAKIKEDHDTALGAEKKKFTAREIHQYLVEQLKDAPLPDGADRAALARLWQADLEQRLDLVYDENGKAVLPQQKGKGVTALNAAGTNPFKFSEDAQAFLSPLGLWAKDMRGKNPADAMQGQQQQQQQYQAQQQQGSGDAKDTLVGDINSFIESKSTAA